MGSSFTRGPPEFLQLETLLLNIVHHIHCLHLFLINFVQELPTVCLNMSFLLSPNPRQTLFELLATTFIFLYLSRLSLP